jgi:hypothetical protein
VFSDLVKNLGPDHLITLTAATIFGSTETTFYVIAVYFGSVACTPHPPRVPAGPLRRRRRHHRLDRDLPDDVRLSVRRAGSKRRTPNAERPTLNANAEGRMLPTS